MYSVFLSHETWEAGEGEGEYEPLEEGRVVSPSMKASPGSTGGRLLGSGLSSEAARWSARSNEGSTAHVRESLTLSSHKQS